MLNEENVEKLDYLELGGFLVQLVVGEVPKPCWSTAEVPMSKVLNPQMLSRAAHSPRIIILMTAWVH